MIKTNNNIIKRTKLLLLVSFKIIKKYENFYLVLNFKKVYFFIKNKIILRDLLKIIQLSIILITIGKA